LGAGTNLVVKDLNHFVLKILDVDFRHHLIQYLSFKVNVDRFAQCANQICAFLHYLELCLHFSSIRLIDTEILLEEKIYRLAKFFPTAEELLIFNVWPDYEVNQGFEELIYCFKNDEL